MDQSASIFGGHVTYGVIPLILSHMCDMESHTHRSNTYILDPRIYLSELSSYDKSRRFLAKYGVSLALASQAMPTENKNLLNTQDNVTSVLLV